MEGIDLTSSYAFNNLFVLNRIRQAGVLRQHQSRSQRHHGHRSLQPAGLSRAYLKLSRKCTVNYMYSQQRYNVRSMFLHVRHATPKNSTFPNSGQEQRITISFDASKQKDPKTT